MTVGLEVAVERVLQTQRVELPLQYIDRPTKS